MIAVAVSALTIYGFTIKAEARGILQDIYALRVGVSPELEVEKLVERHRSHLSWKNCNAKRCEYYFEIRNDWLYWARLEPSARFRAWVAVTSGKVESLGAYVLRDTRVFPTSASGGIVDESITHSDDLSSDGLHYSFSSTPVGKPYLWVTLDREATVAQRSRAYTFSLSCLIKPGGGCDLPCDYLPLAWKDWESELKSSGWGFGEYYPNRSRCE